MISTVQCNARALIRLRPAHRRTVRIHAERTYACNARQSNSRRIHTIAPPALDTVDYLVYLLGICLILALLV
jgi:hypothetical protein